MYINHPVDINKCINIHSNKKPILAVFHRFDSGGF